MFFIKLTLFLVEINYALNTFNGILNLKIEKTFLMIFKIFLWNRRNIARIYIYRFNLSKIIEWVVTFHTYFLGIKELAVSLGNVWQKVFILNQFYIKNYKWYSTNDALCLEKVHKCNFLPLIVNALSFVIFKTMFDKQKH